MTARGSAVAWAWVVAAVVAACGPGGRDTAPPAAEATPARRDEPAPAALPDVSRMAPAVQTRLRDQYASLEAEIRDGGPAAARGEAYGAMGRLLMAAELLDAAEVFFVNAQTLTPDDARWPYYLGHVARLTNRPADAVARFERALVLQPEHVPSLVWLADAYLALGRPDAADPHVAKASQLQPRSAAAWFRWGRAAMARGDIPEGVARLERARSLDPASDAVAYQLGLAHRSAGDLGKAAPYLRRYGDARSVVPDDPLMDTLQDLLTGGGEFYLVRGLQAMEARKWVEAAADLRAAAERLPRDAAVRVNLGTALFLSGDAVGARAATEAAVRIDPRLAKAHYVLGLIVESDGLDAEAIAHFSTAVEIDAGYMEALASLGDALRRTGRVDEALARYRQVLALNPNASQVRFGYGLGLVRLARYREAAAWFEEGARLHPDQPGYDHALARLHAAAPDDGVRDGRRALAVMERLATKDASVPVQETMAMALAEVGRFTDAIVWQRRAIEAATAGQVAGLQENLARYARREPCRVPWRADDPVHRPGAQARSRGAPLD